MWEKIKSWLREFWIWIAFSLAAIAGLFISLFISERRNRKNVEAVSKANEHRAKAEVYEARVDAVEAALPILKEAEATLEKQTEEIREVADKKVEAGRNDDTKKLVEDFRRSGY